MSTIPFSQVVNVVPSVLSAGGNAVDLNGLMLTTSAYAPYGQVLQFASQSAVASYFGSSSTEASLASVYFNGYTKATNKPKNLLFARYADGAIEGSIIGGSMAGVTLAQLQAFSGVLTITVAGTAFTSSAISLTAATSFSNAASLILAAFTTPTFGLVYDSTKQAFIVTSTAAGVAETVAYATGSIAASLKLTQATGAVLSQGANADTPVAAMDAIVLQNQNWACFMTMWEPIDSDKELFATWSNTNQPRYLYVAQDSNALIASTANSTATFVHYLTVNGYIGTLPIYGDATHSAFVLGYAASLDFNRTEGRTALAYCQGAGLTPTVTDVVTYGNVMSNGYNFYGYWGSNNPANNEAWFYPGSVVGDWKWADTYLNQIWLNANLQLAIVNLLLAVNSVPYNQQGYSLIYAAALDPIKTARNFGAIRTGVTLSSAQIAEIKLASGVDPISQLAKEGFYLQIQDAAPAVRAVRGSPPCTLWYTDGGSVQNITLASINVQ